MKMLVDSRLALSVRLVVECLQVANGGGKLSSWTPDGNVIQASLSDEVTKDRINIVGVAIEPEKKCLVSLFRDTSNTSLGQAIFLYEESLGLKQDLKLPVEYEHYIKDSKDEIDSVLERIADKLGLKVPASLKYEGKIERDHERPQSKITVPEVASETPNRGRPADMPGFEDEYQINESDNRILPGLRGLERGYGDSDLYPTGEKYPNLADPTSTMRPLPSMPGQGGMTFDPLQEQAKRRQEEEGRRHGPGWIPGAKFDDPYGHPGSGGSNFPGSAGMGFGGGGFI